MHTTLSSKWYFPALFMAIILLAGCGMTTKKTFLGEPVQQGAGNAVPVSSAEPGQSSDGELSRHPTLNSAEATGVQKMLNVITPYRITIQQGNFVSQEMLARIQPGMTKEQVRFALGTPLLTDLFHSARWDYLFRLQKPNGQVTNNRLVIYFEDNRVARIVNDPLPAETQYLDAIAGPAPKKKANDSARKAAPDADKPDITEQANTAVIATPAASTDAATQTEADTDEAVPASTETVQTTSQPVEAEAVIITPTETTITGTAEAKLSATETVETAPAERNTYHPDPITSQQENAGAAQTIEAAAEQVHSYTPQPVRRQTPEKAATTIRTVSDGQEDDFRPAPNSTMQLHELMQPQ